MISMNRILAVFIAAICIGCGDRPLSTQAKDRSWSSAHHSVRVLYGPQWHRIEPSIDSTEKLLLGFIDNVDGTSYTVKISPDVGREILPDAQYFDAIKDQILSAHPANKLIDEGDVTFHGKSFRRLRFRVHTDKWGQLSMSTYTHRTGAQLVAVQIAFPFDVRTTDEDVLPPALSNLDESTQLFADENLDYREITFCFFARRPGGRRRSACNNLCDRMLN